MVGNFCVKINREIVHLDKATSRNHAIFMHDFDLVCFG